MNIKEVARIGKILFKKGTTIIEGDPKSKNKEARENVITHAITEFSSFIIVRKLFDAVENFDNKEEENLKFYAQSLKISEASYPHKLQLDKVLYLRSSNYKHHQDI